MKTITTFLGVLLGLSMSVILVSTEWSSNDKFQKDEVKQVNLNTETTEALGFLDGSSAKLTGNYTVDKASTNINVSNVESSIVSRNAWAISDCPRDITVNAGNSCTAIATWVAPTSDISANSIVQTVGPISGSTFNLGITTITYEERDGSVVVNTCSFTITVVDNNAPTPDDNTLSDVIAQCEVTALTPPTATDNCGGVVTVDNDVTLPITTQGTTVVTWTYTDENGQATTQTQDVVITDTTAPTPDDNTLSDVIAQCEVTALTAPTATDNCGGVTVTNNATLPITTQGTTVVTWTYADENGQATTQTQDVVITDTTAPTTDDNTLSDVIAQCEVTALTAPTATDNCGGVTVTNNATLPITTQGTTVVTWTYADGNGQITTQTQDVVITDTTAPTPDDNTLGNVIAQCEVIALTAPTATDNCGGVMVTNNATLPITTQGTTVVTWTYTDGNGQITTQTQDVVITDTTAPTPDDNTLGNVVAQCEVTALTAPTATDNCGGVTVTNDATLPITTQGTTVVTWTYTDENGQITTQTQDVVITDTTGPTPDAPTLSDVIAQCEVTALTAPTATDNCGGVTVTNNATLPIKTQGTTVVTWTYTDGNGQITTQTQDVVITDTTGPVAPTLSDVTEECSATATTPTTTDGCSGTLTGTTSDPLTYTAQGTYTIVWNFDDGNGNSIDVNQTVIVEDTTGPTPDVPTLDDVTAQCEVIALTDPTATDNCGGVVTVTNNATLPITTQGTTVVTWTYTDENGQITTQTQDVVITDTAGPTPDVPTLDDVTAQCEVIALTDPTATDNCGGVVTVTNNATLPITTQGTTVVTWTYTDENGQITTQTQNVVIEDTTPPVAACIEGITTIQLDSSGIGSISTEAVDNGSSDNCDTVNLSFVGGIPDLSNNIALNKPAFQSTNYNNQNSYPASRGVDGSTGNFTHTAKAIGEYWEVDLEDDFDIGLIRIWNRGGGCCQDRLNDFRVTLYNGAVEVASQDFTTQPSPSLDITTLTGVANKVRVTQLKNQYLSIGELEVFENGGSTIEFDCTDLGAQTITMVATDASGNTSSCEHNVNIVDTIAPNITCPDDVIVTIDDDINCEATAVTLGTPVTADNCAVANVTNDAPENFPIGDTEIIWTVTDTSGNTATCAQTITVNDDIDPDMTCPDDIVLPADAGFCSAVVTYSLPTVTDCSSFTITQIDTTGLSSGSAFPIGTTTLEYQVLDAGNLLDTCSFTITVVDNIDPTISIPDSSLVQDTDPGLCSASIALDDVSFNDNCSGSALTWTMTGATTNNGTGQVSSPFVFNTGITTITYTVTDANGNTATGAMTVTVSDNELPVIIAPAPITVSAGVNCQISSLALGAAITSDNCGVDSVTNNASPPFVVGTVVVEWTVTDINGNTSSATQQITVVDDIDPVLTLPKSLITTTTSVEDDYNCTVAIDIPEVIANDNCSGSELTWTMAGATTNSGTGQVPSPYTFNLGETIIEYTLTETSSNVTPKTISKILTVNVIDDEAPVIIDDEGTVISDLPDIEVSNDTGVCGASVSWIEPTANDNCAVSTFIQTTGYSNPFTFPIGTTTVIYEAEDASGNSIVRSFDVKVTDDEAPAISHPNQSVDLETTTSADGTGNCAVAIAIPDATIGDNCGVSELRWELTGATTGSGLNQVGTQVFNVGSSVITYTVTDTNSTALENTLSITVSVTDDELPTFIGLDDITVNSCNTEVFYTVTGDDNCGVAPNSIIQIDTTGLTSGDEFPSGTTELKYEITDINDLVFIDTFTITVIDDVLPIVNCPSDVILNTDAGLCTAKYDYQVVATDDCESSPTLTWVMTGAAVLSGTGQIGDYDFPVGTTTVTFTVDDGANTDTCTSTVTVVDNENPILSCPIPAASYNTDIDACTASLTFVATATDNCDSNPTIAYSIAGTPIAFPYDFPIGNTEVDVVANTSNGLSASCSFIVAVDDNQDPVITCPTVASSYSTDAGSCFSLLDLPATVTDNSCDTSATISYTIDGSIITFPYEFTSGSTVVTATADDSNGQSATCEYTVDVIDNEIPVANCIGSLDITLSASGSASITVDDVNNLSSDNCDFQITLDQFDFDCGDLGANTVTMTVTDTEGNSATCTTIVNVLDPASNAGVEINVDNNPVCTNGDIEFTATPINGGTSPIYEWFINEDSQGTNSPNFVPFTPLNDGDKVSVKMQSSLTSCNTPVQSIPIEISVYPIPGITAPADICLGTTANLSSDTNGSWVSNTPSVATVTSSGVINAIAAGTVDFTFTSANGGCTTTTDPIIINPLPELTAPSTICVGTTASVLPNSDGTWTSNNPTIATVDNTGMITGVSAGFATFTFVNDNGCENTTAAVEVLESPIIDTINVSDSALCSGEAITLQASLEPLTNASSQVTLINYNFNSNTTGYSDYDGQEIPGIISDINSSTIAYYNGPGTITGTDAFESDSTTGDDQKSLRQRDGSGFNSDGEWIFNIGGSVLDDYRDFRVYFQSRRNRPNGIPKYIDISYRINGTGAFVDFFRYDIPSSNEANTWREVLIALPDAINNASNLELKLYVNDGYNSEDERPDIRIDNFQVRGSIGGDMIRYSWEADTGAEAGLPASAAAPSSANSIIQVNPEVTTNYTLLVENDSNNCVDTQVVTVAVTPNIEVTIDAEYCQEDDPETDRDESDFVKLIASSPNDPNVTYEWQTDPVQTGAVLYTDIARAFTVVATNTVTGCSTTQTISIAEELVIDGSFTNFDDTAFTFTSDQIYVPDRPNFNKELNPDGGLLGYSVSDSADKVHSGFHGRDHTNNSVGPRNFMIINGDGFIPGTDPKIQVDAWRQPNTPVLPNTDYYYSAWVMRVINASPPELQFRINGELVGFSITPPKRTGNGPEGDKWVRFYGIWNSGTATSADIFIVNLNDSQGGNDYGIDDISFATLSTFVRLETDAETTAQSICENTEMATIDYAIGVGLDEPTITWSKDGSAPSAATPDGLSVIFTGSDYVISGTPTAVGEYEYTLSTNTTSSSCGSKIATGTISVEEAPAVEIEPIMPTTPTSENTYNDIISLLANQGSQSPANFQYVLDASSDPNVGTGDAYYEKLETSTGSLSDYRLLGDTIICSENSSVDLSVLLSGKLPDSLPDDLGTWETTGTGSFQEFSVDSNTATAKYVLGPGENSGIITLSYTLNSTSERCAAVDDIRIEIVPIVTASAGTDFPAPNDCSQTTVNLQGNDIAGTWTVTSGQLDNSYSFSDASLYNSSFTGESGETYTLQWEAANISPCSSADTISIEFENCGGNIDFDGTDDYISFSDTYNMSSGPFSLEAWVKSDNFSGSKTIMSKRDGNLLTSGYDLMLENNRLRFRWNDHSGLLSNQVLSTTKWYHVAVTFDGATTYTLYIDGINMGSTSEGVAPSSSTNRFIIGATDRGNMGPIDFFGGAIDEVRIWDTRITQTQIRQMMNQELERDGTDVSGVVIGQKIDGLQWSNLMGYYQMAVGAQSSVTNGNISDISDLDTNGTLNAMSNPQSETAPIPYVTKANSDWDDPNTWVNGADQQIPNSKENSINGTAQSWNIVQIKHDVTVARAVSLQGLIVDSTKELSVTNDEQLGVNGYLKIDGVLDLEGESQLLQATGSIVDNTGLGVLERDQQGTANLFNYNYWSSPVSDDDNGGEAFSVGGVLNDGSDPSDPKPVAWTNSSDADGTTSPVTLSRRWLYTYLNLPGNSYTSWVKISESSPLVLGQGFIMKGSGTAASDFNYTFIGTPNNGEIRTSITANYQSLLGNPYPSALDGSLFIEDNEPSLKDGTLYFWEHAPSNNSHSLAAYEGGYAVLNLSGGVSVITPPDGIAGIGDAGKIPGRYLPIGQGFFATANATGGSVIFQNSQRAFVKEVSSSSVFLRTDNPNTDQEPIDNQDDFKRIRIDIVTPEKAVRHLLLAFVENGKATDGIDYGYDASVKESFPSDAYFDIEGNSYVIQGVDQFDETQMFPLILKLDVDGAIEIVFDEFENFDAPVDLFIYDALLGTYTQFNEMSFQITLAAGLYKERFFLTFKEDEQLSVIDNEFQDIDVAYLQTTDEIYISTPNTINVKQIYLINIEGKTVGSWNSTNQPLSNEIKIPVKRIAEGHYIIKVETNYSSFNKKIIIKY